MKTIFIDRDGVINKDPGGWTEHDYVTKWDDFYFLPGTLEALKILKDEGIMAIVISNQAGVSKGYFTEKALYDVDKRMLKVVRENGGRIEESFYCIHRDEDNCDCRKPKSGLLEIAAKKYGIDVGSAYFIGDTKADVMAGKGIGARTILVLSGKTSKEDVDKWNEGPDYVFKDLPEAVKQIIQRMDSFAK